ncbi:hypothetical protein J3Q64DRAFT_1774308 [Phycomyces blakesleeanus]|uniref:Uncharacterized protein n=1 Tax=Phycomyces blakesleeanus TaxID=4837 RepID=A0ABR3AJ47_PHYBL
MHIHVNLFFFYSFFLDNLYWYWIFGLKFAYLDSISINCAIYFAILICSFCLFSSSCQNEQTKTYIKKQQKYMVERKRDVLWDLACSFRLNLMWNSKKNTKRNVKFK